MTITVDIAPEVQAELARQAVAHGRPVEEYAASLLDTNTPSLIASQPSVPRLS